MTDEVVAPGPAVIEQNTSGVVGVLAEALAQHQVVSFRSGDPWRVTCACRFEGDVDTHSAHVASVVAALPNIAVVMLPEPTVREHGGFSWGADEDGENPTVTATAGYDTVRLYQEDARHTSGDAVEIAGFLLAAARAAGGQA